MPRFLKRVPAAILILAMGIGCDGGDELPNAEPQTPPPLVEARSSVDKAVATTGDLIVYEVVIEHDEGIPVEVPDPGDQIAGFRIVDLGVDPPVTKDGRVTERRWYNLRADLVGSYILPGVRLAYTVPESATSSEDQQPEAEDQQPEAGNQKPKAADPQPKTETRKVLTTSEIFVEVQSVLPKDGEATDIRGLKPLEETEAPLPWVYIGIAGAIVLLLGVIAFLIIRRRRRTLTVPAIPPHELAFAALDDLRHTDFDNPEAVRVYYFQLSEVVRQYVEGRFSLNATDLTTEEIVDRLDAVPDLIATPRQKLRDFLVESDTVKFAGHAPSSQEIGDTYEKALSFVEETVPIAPDSDPANPSPGQQRGVAA